MFPGNLHMKLNPDKPLNSDGLLWINVTVKSQNTSPYRWQFPCVRNIQCSLVSPPLFNITGNIIFSCISVVLTIFLCCSLKLCYWRAEQNDKALVSRLNIPF